MTFYINEVHLDDVSDWAHRCVGLFDSNQWNGRGSFCGYYGAEYYLNTTLLAYGIQLVEGSKGYNPKLPFDGGFFDRVNQHFDEIAIGSGMWEKTIEADTTEEAIAIFKCQAW